MFSATLPTPARSLLNRVIGPATGLGRAVFAIGAIAWIVAVLLGWEEFAIVAGVCLVAMVIAIVFTLGRTQIDVDLELSPHRIVAGDTAVADFTVRNAASRWMLPVRLEVPVSGATATMNVPALPAGGIYEDDVRIPTKRRGVLLVGPTRSVRGDPLALMRREIEWEDAHELFVHPLTSSLDGVSSGWLRDLEGQPTNDRSPNDVAFHTLREYTPGDDRRHVHWRTSARINKLMVREFIDNRRSHLGLVVDTNPASYTDAEEFELAISMAASLGLRAINEGQETSCVAGAHGVASHNGQALLDGMARVELGVPTISIQETAMRAEPTVRAASVIALVTGSGLPVGELPAAAQRFGNDVQMLGLRAELAGTPSMARGARVLTLTAESLDSFTRVMWSIGGSR